MPAPDTSLPPRVVLYDGVCGFCDRAIQRWLDLDRDQCLSFAPLQGQTAAVIRQRHPEIPPGLDSIVYFESHNGVEQVSWHSQAILRIAAALQWRSPWLTLVRYMPRPLADLSYRTFAALRYRIFGKLDQCRVPSPQQRARFLD